MNEENVNKRVNINYPGFVNGQGTPNSEVQNAPQIEAGPQPEDELEQRDGQYVYTSEWLRKYTQIGGWHKFFFVIMILNPLSDIFLSIKEINEGVATALPGFSFLIGGVLLLDVVLLGMACYSIYAFISRKPNAVFWARAFVIIIFLMNVFVLVLYSTLDLEIEIKDFLRSTVWFGIWIAFLAVSDSVNRVIPHEFRKVTKIDWGILAALVIIPLLVIGMGYYRIKADYDERINGERELKMLTLPINQHTDGRIIITETEGYVFDTEESDDVVFYQLKTPENLESSEEVSCEILSDYNDTETQAEFEKWWEQWKEARIYSSVDGTKSEGVTTIDGNQCFYKISSLYSEELWRFYMIFDEQSMKCCYVSSVDNKELDDNYMQQILESIKFHQ